MAKRHPLDIAAEKERKEREKKEQQNPAKPQGTQGQVATPAPTQTGKRHPLDIAAEKERKQREQREQNTAKNNYNAGVTNSGQSRDQFDSSVRKNYQASKYATAPANATPVADPTKPNSGYTIDDIRQNLEDSYSRVDNASKLLNNSVDAVTGSSAALEDFFKKYNATAENIELKMAASYGATRGRDGTLLFEDEESYNACMNELKVLEGLYNQFNADYDQYNTLLEQYNVEEGKYNEWYGLAENYQPRKATVKDLLWGSFNQGYYNSIYGQESFKDMFGLENEADSYKQLLASEEYQFEPGGWFGTAVSGAANQVGQWVRQASDPKTVSAMLGAAGAAALVGQAGPQVALPEEIITVPGAVAAAYKAGSAVTNFEIEAGLAYQEMLEAGVSEETARLIATGVGGGNAALEALQIDELVKGLKVFANKKTYKNTFDMLFDVLKQRTPGVANQVVQEVAQEGVTIAGTEVGSLIDKGEAAYTVPEIAKRLGETALSSTLTFGLMDAPGATMNIAGNMASDHRYGKIGNEYQIAAEDVIAEGLTFDENTEAYKIASKLQAAVDSGKKVSNKDLGKAVAANARAVAEEAKRNETEAKQAVHEAVKDVNVEDVIREGLSYGEDTAAFRMAAELEEKWESLDDISEEEIYTAIKYNEIAAREADGAAGSPTAVSEADTTLEDLARETVAERNGTAQSEDMGQETGIPKVSIPYNAMSMENPVRQRVMAAKRDLKKWTGYGDAGQKAFEQILESGNQTPEQVRSQFQTSYELGRLGTPRKSINLASDLQERAFTAGYQDYLVDREKDENKKFSVSKEAGFDRTGAPADVTDTQAEILDMLAKNMGSKSYFDGDQDFNAEIQGDGTVRYSTTFNREILDDSGNVVKTLTVVDHALHELGAHRAMQVAPDATRAFVNKFYAYKMEGMPSTVGTLAEQKQEQYGRQKVALTTDKAFEEVIANEIFPTLYRSNEQELVAGLRRAFGGNTEEVRQGARTFRDVLNDMWRKIKEFAAKLRGKGDIAGAKEAEQAAATVRELRDMFEAILKEVSDKVKAAEANGETATKNTAQKSGERQLSINESYAAEMLAWDGKSKRVFTLGTTSEALQSIGIHDSKIILNSGKARDILTNPNHDMDQATLAKIPEVLEKPIAILKSQQVTVDNENYNDGNTSRLVIFGTVNDTKGVPVSVVLELMPIKNGKVLEMSIVASAYGKTTHLSGFVQSSEVLYLDEDKKRTNSWLQSVGVQFPSDAINYGSMGKVTYSSGKVNIEGVPFSQISGATYVAAPKQAPPMADWQKKLAELHSKMTESEDDGSQKSLKVTDKKTLDFLNEQIERGEYDPVKNPNGGYIKVYRSFQVIDGKLYAPMNAVDRDADGKNHRLGYNSQYRVWEMATESPEIAQRYMDANPDAPYAKFDLDGVDNKTGGVAYNPYLHASNLVLNDQFSAAYRRNLITVECYVPVSEANGAYKAKYAKDATGWVEWKPGGVAGKLMKQKPEYTRKLFVSRYMLPVREVEAPELASMYKEYLDGTGIKVPWNVVTPELRRELVKAGVGIDYKDVYQSTDKKTGEKKYAKFDEVFPGERQSQYSLKDEDGIQTATNKDGEVVAETHKDGTTMFSLKTYKDDGRAYLHNWLGKKVKSNAITQAEADDIKRQLDEFYDICQKFTDKYGTFGAWSNAEVVMGKDGKPAFSVVKANGEYSMNLDFSLVCKKRRTLDAVFREMINRGTMDDVELGEEQIAKINQIIRESGFETACALCFVDSKRYRQAMVADNFVSQYNDLVEMLIPAGSDIQAHRFDFLERGAKNNGRGLHTVPDSELGKGIVKLKKVMQNEPSNKTVRYKIASHLLNNPQDRRLVMRSEFMNTDGFEAITVKNRKVLGLYNSSKGSGGPKAALSDVQYLGDILKKSNFTPARAYAVGGVRIQSFSDYIPRLVFDYLQMIADLSAKKLPAHAYTKEEMFALQFGMTGIKVNLSLVPAVDPEGVAPGLDAKGNYTWYDGQSFGSDVNVKGSGQTGFKRAVEIQNAAGYSANCGTIAVGISDEHIWKMLNDDDIRMIIPYHKSSLNHIVAVLNNIDKYTDYTGVQNTRFKATGSKIDGKDFNFNDALRKLGDAKAAADAYLEWCEQHDYIPKFDTFAEHENYYKLLEDFSTYDNGVNAPQGPVTMTFPGKDSAFGSMTQLIERGLEEDAILEGRRQGDVPKIVDRIEAVYREGGMKQGAQFSLKNQDDLVRQNAKLKEVNQELQAQFKTTKFAKVDKKALRQFAKQLLKDYQSGADIDETRDALDGVFTYIANGENGETAVWEVAYERAYEAAVSILSNSSTLNDELFQAYKQLRDDLKNTGITIDKKYDHDLIGYESISEFRRANFGRIKIVNDGTPVDVMYQNLAWRYSEFFDEGTYSNQADQLSHIAEVLDSLQPTEVNPYSSNMREAATWLANDIMERYFELPQAKPTFADKAQQKLTKQVIKDHEKMERLREQKNERIASLIEERREKVKEVARKEKDKRDQKVREIKDRFKAKEAKMSENKKASILRERIIRHTQGMSQKLLHPTDKQHVPENLRKSVAAVLDAINLESNYTYDPDTYHEVTRKDGKSGGFTGKHIKDETGLPTKRTKAFQELRKAYQDIIKDDSADIVVDPTIEAMLDLVVELQDVKLADMNLRQLQTVWDVVRVVEHTINTAGKLLSETKYERTVEWASAMANDTATRRSKRGGKAGAIRIDMENPYTFFSHYGESGKAVFRMLRDAQDKQQTMVEEVRKKVRSIVDPKTIRKLEKETAVFTTERGDKLTLTTAQIMDIYLLTKRQQAHDHLLKGGIVQPEVKSKNIKRGTDAILLSAADLSEIVGTLDSNQREIANKLQEMTRTTLADYGNEASMKAYGYKKFTGNDYWPIKSAREGVHSNVEKGGNNTRSIKNIGLAKSVMPHANNPLDIGGVFQTFASHAADMTDYAAWLCPMEDANRLFNFQFRDDLGQRTGKTIKGLLDRVGGKGAQQYWHNLMEDIQNGIKSQADNTMIKPINKIIGNVRGASVGANIRVIVQQPTAILRAAAVLNPIDMTKGLVAGGGWKKAVQHSPIAQRKNMGGFDISSPAQMNEILYDSQTPLQRFNNAMMWGAGKADSVTWGRIWNACEWAVKRDRKDLTPRSDEFYEAVNELFTEVVDQSQVVDGVLQRSQLMRSNNALLNQATAFMGEPTMTMNMMLRAYDGLVNETDKSKRGKAIKTFGRTAMVLLVTNAVNAVMQSLVDAWRDDEDDEYWNKLKNAFFGVTGEEETAWEKATAAVLGGNLGSSLNPAGYVPFAKDILSILQGYNVTRADADVMGDIINATTTFIESVGGDGKRTIAYATKNLAQQVGKVFGISAPNILRDVWGIVRTIALETGNIPLQYEMEKAIYKIDNKKNASRFVEILYKAYREDKDVFDKIYSEMLSGDYFSSVNGDGEVTTTADYIAGALKSDLIDDLFVLYKDDQTAYKEMYNDLIKRDFLHTGVKNKDPDLDTYVSTAEAIASAMEARMKKDQGVKKVDDLEQRYLSPTQQPKYDSGLKSVQSSSLWRGASDEQKEKVETQLYNLSVMNSDGEKLQEKITEGKPYGLTETEYLLYDLALDMVDQPNKSGKLGGSPTNEEKAAAFAKLGDLGGGDIAYLWDTKDGYAAYAGGLDMRTYVDRVAAGQSVDVEKVLGAMDEGMSEDDYYGFLDMLKEVDQPTKSGKMGTFTQDEAKAAISAMPGLTNAQRAWLWQSVGSNWSAKNNPWK